MSSGEGGLPGHDASDLVAGLFRRESARLIASLSRLFGPRNIDLAEDVVQDALETALQSWRFEVPANPAAWLNRVARNGALDVIRRMGTERRFAAELLGRLESEWTLSSTVEEALAESAAAENQIRLMLTLCRTELSEETHVTLILKFLCGFSTHEIATAYLTSDATIDKRLQRGRAALKTRTSLAALADRVEPADNSAVLAALYLLFNEGYHGSHAATPVRAVLCDESIRLCALLTQNDHVASSPAHALMALMYLAAARIAGRLDRDGVPLPLHLQDRSRWRRDYIERGTMHLSKSAIGSELSQYHLEAGIACHHAMAASVEETNWPEIRRLYDLLYEQSGSPVIAVSRALAVAMSGDTAQALLEIDNVGAAPQILCYPYYWAARGEIYARAQQPDEAHRCFSKAAECARSNVEQLAFLRTEWWSRPRQRGSDSKIS